MMWDLRDHFGENILAAKIEFTIKAKGKKKIRKDTKRNEKKSKEVRVKAKRRRKTK